MQNDTQVKTRNRSSMILVFALVVVPVLLALWSYLGGEAWQPQGTINNGVLIIPARPLPVDLALVDPAGEPLREAYLSRKWTLTYIGAAACDELCAGILYRIQQVRLAMGEETNRIQRLYLLIGDAAIADAKRIQAQFAGLDAAVVSDTEHQALLQLFAVDGTDPAQARRIYLVDPHGNLMMYYEPDAEPNGILRDLRKLLKLSRIG